MPPAVPYQMVRLQNRMPLGIPSFLFASPGERSRRVKVLMYLRQTLSERKRHPGSESDFCQ